jgi:hypothetical protein
MWSTGMFLLQLTPPRTNMSKDYAVFWQSIDLLMLTSDTDALSPEPLDTSKSLGAARIEQEVCRGDASVTLKSEIREAALLMRGQ